MHALPQRTNLCFPDDQEAPDKPPPSPRHIALIMDGNGRWARRQGRPRTHGHRAAVENILPIVQTCLAFQIPYLTMYVFSTENWKRPRPEVNIMLNLVGEFIDRELATFHAWGVRLLHLGNMEGIGAPLQQKIRHALHTTRLNQAMTLAVALNYGSRSDLVCAIQALLAQGLPAEAIDEQTIAAYLSTHALPDPDLVIRTSGEQRLSNFLLWESAYSVFWAMPVYWPDFGPAHLCQAIQHMRQRQTPAPAPVELAIAR